MSNEAFTMINSEPGLWTVGCTTAKGDWSPMSDHSDIVAAAHRCHILNGGSMTLEQFSAEWEKGQG